MDKKPKKTSKAVGRPKKYNIDKEELFKLAKYNLTNIEIADIIGCDESLLIKNYSEYLTKGRGELKKRLRQAQYDMAIGDVKNGVLPNVTMLIWLGKQILGQSEKAEIQMNRPIEEIEYMEI